VLAWCCIVACCLQLAVVVLPAFIPVRTHGRAAKPLRQAWCNERPLVAAGFVLGLHSRPHWPARHDGRCSYQARSRER
jgi:hypothetical protein